MNKALAATISVTVGVGWFGVLAYFLYTYATGLFAMRRRMSDQGRTPFFWNGRILAQAFGADRDAPEAARVRKGFIGSIALLVLMIVASVLLVAATRS